MGNNIVALELICSLGKPSPAPKLANGNPATFLTQYVIQKHCRFVVKKKISGQEGAEIADGVIESMHNLPS